MAGQRAYFQQHVSYEIQVKLDDNANYLRGNEKLVYKNNSPETLDRIYMHLWPNAYKDVSSAFARQKREAGSGRFAEAPAHKRGFIDSLSFVIDGKKVEWQTWEDNPDIAVLMLPQPLAPGKSLTLSTPFRVKIPASFSRLGHIGQQYQICQWYPKPAVFDRDGWHPMPYLDQGEFYSEFGDFDVTIEVPKNYVVGATGDLAANDPEWDWLSSREAKSRELLEKPVAEAIFEAEFPEGEYKKLRFKQSKVHDFAWFCDKSYYVLADTVKLPNTGREVRCVALFTNLSRDLWKACPRYIAQSVYDYSRWSGDYAYAHATAVDGALSAGAGMEYPNITVLGAGGKATTLERVTMHEVGHNWFYGMLGSNERLHPWMDEGLNSYFEARYWQERHDGKSGMIPGKIAKMLGLGESDGFLYQEAYRYLAGQGLDQPIEYPSEKYININYGLIVYQKSGLAFQYLEHYLGREVIDHCFREYFAQWKFRHPQPEDIQAVFETVSGKDLAWFFGAYINGTHQLDFRIKKVEGNTVTLQNKTGITLPASVSTVDKEGNILHTVWSKPFIGETEIQLPEDGAHKLKVDADKVIPEYRVSNNHVRRKGLFRRSRPLRLAFGYKYPDPERFTLNLLPVLGFNTTDGFMAGLLIHHGFFPKKGFEFHLMPMYGFGSKRMVGSAGFTLRWTPEGIFRKVELHSKFSSFSTFARNKTFLDFHLRKKDARSHFNHKISLISQILALRQGTNSLLPSDWYLPVYGAATWEMDTRGLNSTFATKVEIGGNVAEKLGRISVEGSYVRKLKKKMAVGLRGFAGAILSSAPAPYLLQYRVSGSADPFGEHILFDRARKTTWLGNQLVTDHGGFSSRTGGSFDQGLLSLNAYWRSPFKLVSIFGDVAYGLGSASVGSQGYYDAGIRLNLVKGALEINLPLVSTGFGGLPIGFNDFSSGINFRLKLMELGRMLDVAKM